ncbi:MAG: TIGR01459 family HAD-type hydrolase [Parvibaculales bacterium]
MDERNVSSPVPKIIAGLAELSGRYNALLCDVWGVLHNGRQAFDGAYECLKNWRAGGGKVLLLSNAPRPGRTVAAQLDRMGVAGDAFDAVLTSGDVAQQMTLQRIKDGQRCFHVGPDKDMDLIEDAKIPLSKLEEADFILFTGMYDDDVETPDDYRAMMATWQARNLPVLCANPDRKVQMADKVIYCAGAVAEIYEKTGGEVVWLGKPYLPVYQQAREKLAAMLDAPKILAVGDGPKTDIPGAANAGIDALFISGGLAGASGHAIDTPQDIAALLAEENTHAHYAMRHLVW